jgi:hypothetical protein
MTKHLYNLANLRDLLLRGFDDSDLRRLCHDVPEFRPVYDQLARSTGKAEIVDRLIEHAEKHLLVDTLLALAKKQNPARFEEHGPYYDGDPTDALQMQLSDLAKKLAITTSMVCVFHSRAKLNSVIKQLQELESVLSDIFQLRTCDEESRGFYDIPLLVDHQARLRTASSTLIRNHAHALARVSAPRAIAGWENRVKRLLKEQSGIDLRELEEHPKSRQGRALLRKYRDLRLAAEQVRTWKHAVLDRHDWVDEDVAGWASLL